MGLKVGDWELDVGDLAVGDFAIGSWELEVGI
jgi:hypothetical protein